MAENFLDDFIERASKKEELFESLWNQKFSKILANRYRIKGNRYIFLDKLTYEEYLMIEEFFKENHNLLKNRKYKPLGFEKWENTRNIFIEDLYDIF